MTRCSLLLGLMLVVAPGCVAGDDDPQQASSRFALTMSAADTALVLELVNYPGTDAALLDGPVGLDSRAARSIIAHRNGADGVALTKDDDLFDDLAELDAVAYVGDGAFQKLQAYALLHPAPSAEIVETVGFRGWESEAVVWGVNHSSESELDQTIGLDARAAHNLVAGAPYASVAQMSPVAYVGVSALALLRGHAATWWQQRATGAPPPVTYHDGVPFDAAAAVTALDIANRATQAELLTHGLCSMGATAVVGHRPYATLAAVSAVQGVGSATMQALHDYSTSGQWAPADFVIDQDQLSYITMLIKQGLWEDEGFADDLIDLSSGDEATFLRIMTGLEAEVDRLAGPFLGTHWADYDTAREAVGQATGVVVKARTRTEGWSYLATLGVKP